MNIWGFQKDSVLVYKTFRIYRHIKEICLESKYMLIAFATADCELFCWGKFISDFFTHKTIIIHFILTFYTFIGKDFEIFHKEKQDDHIGKITCIDSIISKGLFATGGEDGYVKVWTRNKVLIREIRFPEEINTV